MNHQTTLPPLLLALACCAPASAQQSADDRAATATVLPPVLVVGTPQPRSELRTPAAVGVIDATVLHSAQPQIDLAETLDRLPGIDVRDRHNDAQDLQIQSRGYGARASFGVRGIQLRADGIPLTAPDGQGQTSNLLISGLDRIEVLRGPLAYQYGNSAGGVIAAYSAPPSADDRIDATLGGGSGETWRASVAGSGRAAEERLGYRFEFARFDRNGSRAHSASRRNQAALNATYDLGHEHQLRLLASRIWDACAQDPLGLTRAQFEDNRQQATPQAETYNTRKSIDDWRAGIGYSGAWTGASQWELLAYADARDVVQFLSIPPSAQASPARAGGVIDLARDGYGIEARATQRFAPLSLSAGVQWRSTDERRRGYENFVGDQLGVRGALRRDEDNRITSFDPFVVVTYPFAPRWTLDAALRHSQVRFTSDDHYVRTGNPDDSGRASFAATLPALSLSFAPAADRLLYLSAGAGFETPTFNELSYRSDGGEGLNLALDAAHSRSVELGWKQQLLGSGLLSLALFHIDGDDDIVPAATIDGRASFQNGDTRRRGVEAGLWLPLPQAFALQLAADWLDARFAQTYRYRSTGDTVTVPAGNRVPGVARTSLFAELAWRRGRPGLAAMLEARYVDAVPVDDRNSDTAPGYGVADAAVAYRWASARHGGEVFLRVHNLFDAHYAGSVIVNDGNGRFFEPAPGRGAYAGVSLRFGGSGA